jgi:TPR repeat protein
VRLQVNPLKSATLQQTADALWLEGSRLWAANPDGAKAVEYFEAAVALSGHPAASNALAWALMTGQGVVACDPVRAHKLFEEAAQNGDPSASRNFAVIRWTEGGTSARNRAFHLYYSASSTDAAAAILLADVHKMGEPGVVNKDVSMSQFFLSKASRLMSENSNAAAELRAIAKGYGEYSRQGVVILAALQRWEKTGNAEE